MANSQAALQPVPPWEAEGRVLFKVLERHITELEWVRGGAASKAESYACLKLAWPSHARAHPACHLSGQDTAEVGAPCGRPKGL